nr:NAD-dependent epimerase/dehydratase family protein [Candidatus Methanofastidiosa archaeon]
ALVTGGAGFIGSHLVDALVKEHQVTVIDNLSSGKEEYVSDEADLIIGDLTDLASIKSYFDSADVVFHIAANPDVSLGSKDTRVHIDQNILATHNVLEAMRLNDVRDIVFTSSSTIYGLAPIPTPEDYGPLVPRSIYGASKLACEALISSYCHSFGMRSWIYRFANIIGTRSNHGIIPDFIAKLRSNEEELVILGNGKQTKSYCHISDCIDAMLYAYSNSDEDVNIFNIGSDDTISAVEIADLVGRDMGLNPSYTFTGGDIGWVGDIPKMLLSIAKIRELGWGPRYNSREAVNRTIKDILADT